MRDELEGMGFIGHLCDYASWSDAWDDVWFSMWAEAEVPYGPDDDYGFGPGSYFAHASAKDD